MVGLNQISQEMGKKLLLFSKQDASSKTAALQFVQDLVSVFNTTVLSISDPQAIMPSQLSLLQDISDNLSELVAGIQSLSIRLNTEKLDYPVEDLKSSLLALCVSRSLHVAK